MRGVDGMRDGMRDELMHFMNSRIIDISVIEANANTSFCVSLPLKLVPMLVPC